MTEEKFAYVSLSVGFVQDKEYGTMFQHPDCSYISVWLNKSGNSMTISLNMEYQIEVPVQGLRKRLEAIKTAFDL